MSIAILHQPGCEVINFEINLIFEIKPSKKSRQKFKYPEKKKSFYGKIQIIFHNF